MNRTRENTIDLTVRFYGGLTGAVKRGRRLTGRGAFRRTPVLYRVSAALRKLPRGISPTLFSSGAFPVDSGAGRGGGTNGRTATKALVREAQGTGFVSIEPARAGERQKNERN